MSKHLNIGLFGFGCVGQGLYAALHQAGIEGLSARILGICVKHREKERPLPREFFCYDKNLLLDNPDINVIVELIDDPEESWLIVQRSLQSGKAVVTANKAMLSKHLPEIIELQNKYNVPVLYEAACCGSIPIIRTLEEYYDNDSLLGISGIVNGTTNYILTQMNQRGINFDKALALAQEKGFAESDPTLDITGGDARSKLQILIAHTFGILTESDSIPALGIQNLNEKDLEFAKKYNFSLRLLAKADESFTERKLSAFVLPHFVENISLFSHIDNEHNAVRIDGLFSGTQHLTGKGAGSHPTGAAVLSDISALGYHYRYEYKKLHRQNKITFSNAGYTIPVYCRVPAGEKLGSYPFSAIFEEYKQGDEQIILGNLPVYALHSGEYTAKGISFIALPDDFMKN
jgi:homoserine dehydrogenase